MYAEKVFISFLNTFQVLPLRHATPCYTMLRYAVLSDSSDYQVKHGWVSRKTRDKNKTPREQEEEITAARTPKIKTHKLSEQTRWFYALGAIV